MIKFGTSPPILKMLMLMLTKMTENSSDEALPDNLAALDEVDEGMELEDRLHSPQTSPQLTLEVIVIEQNRN